MKTNSNKINSIISEEDHFRIESICERLKGSVSIVEIINWLKNFKEFEVNKALSILEKLEYISENEIIEFYDVGLKKILEDNNDDIILHAVSEYGKSSTLMVYYFKKTPTFKKFESRIDFYFHYNNFKHKLKKINTNTSIIFLDDFSGSGKQFNNYYKTFVKPQITNNKYINKLFFLTLFFLPKAKNAIFKSHPEINLIGEIRNPAFLNNGSVFGYRNSMLPFRDLCYKYGKDLFSTYNKETKTNELHPLGYGNSQALIVFAYNVPNNTLPIIWSSRNWIPLYPRVPNLKISRSKTIRKELAHEMGLIKNSEIANVLYSGENDLGWKTVNFITKTDFVTYSIIKMLKQKRTIPVICQILGITENDYVDLITEKKDLFEDNKTLTEYGNSVYLEIKNQLKLVKKEISKNDLSFEIKNSEYLPKNFKGVT
ncbi:hypothetical protein BXU11_16035 [Flavobacterium sp. LM5]|uniref:phosphoribosyltransferase-like protein n=1 Tax=Flavobacterium sp. LM5 TaxID=1938610 RepID=UPI000992F1E6|nr:hypothetical protein [Flavobacterium sp. LM5]OOV25059.1 hypothetical protein BXU11_16035 [Flavobacterium sp. LM5]